MVYSKISASHYSERFGKVESEKWTHLGGENRLLVLVHTESFWDIYYCFITVVLPKLQQLCSKGNVWLGFHVDSKVVVSSGFSPAPNRFPSLGVLVCGSQVRGAEPRKWPLGEKVSHWRGKVVARAGPFWKLG